MSKIFVWDLPLRLFHWLLVLLVVVSVVSVEIGGNAMQVHMLSGYTILALVLFRVLWGFFGGTYARFSSFVRSPRAAIDYLRALRRNESPRYLGHNPAGAWSVLAMLALLLLQALTGLFSNDDIATKGPLAKLVSKALSDRITGIHHLNVDLLYVLIALHLAAVAFYHLRKRENLVGPMLTGYRDARPGESVPARGKAWLAAPLFATCALGVYLLIHIA